MKRYAIVRVDQNYCPYYSDKNFTIPSSAFCENRFECKDCRYGDTKEQLVAKVEQILFKNAPKETYQPRYIEQKRKILKLAKEIVEFLGVEE